MAVYSIPNLIARIDQIIKTNGIGSITAIVENGILKDIIDSLVALIPQTSGSYDDAWIVPAINDLEDSLLGGAPLEANTLKKIHDLLLALDQNKQDNLGFTPENTANKNVANGYVGLDENGKIPVAYTYGAVDEILEYDTFPLFPAIGIATTKMYLALDTGKIYRWAVTAYAEIIASPGSTDAVPEGAINKYFTESRVLNTVITSITTAYNTAVVTGDKLLTAISKLQTQINNRVVIVPGSRLITTPEADKLSKVPDDTNAELTTIKTDVETLKSSDGQLQTEAILAVVANKVDKYGNWFNDFDKGPCLYNWHAVNTGKLAPTDWRVATKADWETLNTFLGANAAAKLRERGTIHWTAPNQYATDEFGMALKAYGCRYDAGNFNEIRDSFSAWTSTPHPTYSFSAYKSYLNVGNSAISINDGGTKYGRVAMCVRDSDPGVSQITYNGFTYDVIKIGAQYWLKQPLCTTKYNDNTNIALIEDSTAWAANTTGAYCYYNNAQFYVAVLDSFGNVVKTQQVQGTGGITQEEMETAITNAVNDLINGAPGALNTLKELADALADDAAFATTVTNALALKANKIANPTANKILKTDANGQPVQCSFSESEIVQLAAIDMSDVPEGGQKILMATKEAVTGATLFSGSAKAIDVQVATSFDTLLADSAAWVGDTLTLSGDNRLGALGENGQRHWMNGNTYICSAHNYGTTVANGSATWRRTLGNLMLDATRDAALITAITGATYNSDNSAIITTRCRVGVHYTAGNGYVYICYAENGTNWYIRRIGQPDGHDIQISDAALKTELEANNWATTAILSPVATEKGKQGQVHTWESPAGTPNKVECVVISSNLKWIKIK